MHMNESMTTNQAAVEIAFVAHLAAHLAKDQAMNRESGYLPTAGVLAQRELHRQADEVRKISESVRADFWLEWAETPRCARVQVGFSDNRDPATYRADIERLRPLLEAAGFKLMARGGFQFVSLNRPLAGEVQARHADWLGRIAGGGCGGAVALTRVPLVRDVEPA